MKRCVRQHALMRIVHAERSRGSAAESGARVLLPKTMKHSMSELP